MAQGNKGQAPHILNLGISQGMRLTTYLHLVPRLRMSGAIPPLPLNACMVCVGKTLPFLPLPVVNLVLV